MSEQKTLVGKPFPSFSLPDHQGLTITNLDLLDHWTVIYAYPKDNTPGCTAEACDFRDQRSLFKKHGAKIFGISRDTLRTHLNFIERQGLPFPLLSDPEVVLLTELGAFGKKMMYGKEVQGVIRSTFLIDPQGIVRQVWTKVKVKGHVDEVLATLKERKG